jgi:hypothetical protein
MVAFLALTTVVNAAEQARTRGGQSILVNKDVNGERWAITYDEGRQSMTGNVLLPDGSATFIDCDARPQGVSDVGCTCYSFNGTNWSFLANVSLPRAFFGLGQQPGGTCTFFSHYGTYLTYGDSCGTRAEGDLDLGGGGECDGTGRVYDATDLAIEGAEVSVSVDGADNATVRISYSGACSGTATGAGRVTDTSTGGWRVEGTFSGSTTCCQNMTGTFAIHR